MTKDNNKETRFHTPDYNVSQARVDAVAELKASAPHLDFSKLDAALAADYQLAPAPASGVEQEPRVTHPSQVTVDVTAEPRIIPADQVPAVETNPPTGDVLRR